MHSLTDSFFSLSKTCAVFVSRIFSIYEMSEGDGTCTNLHTLCDATHNVCGACCFFFFLHIIHISWKSRSKVNTEFVRHIYSLIRIFNHTSAKHLWITEAIESTNIEKLKRLQTESLFISATSIPWGDGKENTNEIALENYEFSSLCKMISFFSHHGQRFCFESHQFPFPSPLLLLPPPRLKNRYNFDFGTNTLTHMVEWLLALIWNQGKNLSFFSLWNSIVFLCYCQTFWLLCFHWNYSEFIFLWVNKSVMSTTWASLLNTWNAQFSFE